MLFPCCFHVVSAGPSEELHRHGRDGARAGAGERVTEAQHRHAPPAVPYEGQHQHVAAVALLLHAAPAAAAPDATERAGGGGGVPACRAGGRAGSPRRSEAGAEAATATAQGEGTTQS